MCKTLIERKNLNKSCSCNHLYFYTLFHHELKIYIKLYFSNIKKRTIRKKEKQYFFREFSNQFSDFPTPKNKAWFFP